MKRIEIEIDEREIDPADEEKRFAKDLEKKLRKDYNREGGTFWQNKVDTQRKS